MADGETIRFIGSAGAELSGVLRRPSGQVVGSALLAHCFTCSKDIHTITRLSTTLVDAGWVTMAFDFTGLGNSEGSLGDTTVTTEVGDISRAAVALLESGSGPCLLIGHSLGGAAAVLAAHRLHTLDGVIAIAAPSDVKHVKNLLGAAGVAAIRKVGRADVEIGGRVFAIGIGFLDDLEIHDVMGAVARLEVPLLVVEAGADEVVDAHQTRRLAAASSNSTIVTITGADHLFTNRRHADMLAGAVLDWLRDR